MPSSPGLAGASALPKAQCGTHPVFSTLAMKCRTRFIAFISTDAKKKSLHWVTLTGTHMTVSIACLIAPGEILTSGRMFGEEPGGKDDGVPDGIKVDKKGNLYVTGPKGIWVWDSQGHHLGTIVVPEQPANLGWGDADYRTLYITATTSVYRLRTKAQGFVPYLHH